jgi:hypothetical protein
LLRNALPGSGQTGLDSGVTERPRSVALAGKVWHPVHLGIEPPFHRCKQRLPVSASSVTRAAGIANSGNMQAIDRIVI